MIKKTDFHIFLLILSIVAIQPCFSSGTPETNTAVDGAVISARGALGRLEAATSGPLYTGNGGENIRLAVLAPQVQGEVPAYLPIYIQGLLNNNFNKYSAINLIDRQNLDRIIAEQKIAASGSYSDNDFVRIGNLANAQYFLFGTIQKLSGSTYSLQLSITDSSTGVRKANFMKDGTLTQLEGSGTLINEATADILAQLGVELTETGKQTLLAGNTSAVKAEAGLARGITAQAGGSEVEALFNFTQAITFDPSQIEALSRLNTLSSTISGGTISQRILNDIQARDRWLEVFKETTRFFNDHPPFEIIFDPNLIQIGETDYVKRTANIGMRIALDSSEAGFDALNALLEGLEKTGRREVWGFSGWPLMDVTPKTAGTVVFNGRRSFSYKIDVALINEANKTISNSSITLNTETINFSAGNRIIFLPSIVGGVVNFRNVKAEDLTPALTIVIVAVNGISSREINISGYMKIETGDLGNKEKELETVEQRRQRERETAEQQAQREQETATNKAAMNIFFNKKKINANRHFFNLSGYGQWADDGKGGGLEIGYYLSPVPFTVIGIEARFGLFYLDHSQSETIYSFHFNTTERKEENNIYTVVSPALGLVWPFNNEIKLFTDGMFELGNFSDGLKGTILDWLTPAFDIGMQFYFFTVKYRGSWFENCYTHGVSIGFIFKR